jgi:putative endonuclease
MPEGAARRLTSPGRLSGRAETGARGEALVATRLERDGYTIVARNWRCPVGELDIVASLGDLLVFVEVRTVTSDFLETPVLSVNLGKQGRVGRAADVWLRAHAAQPDRIRFDVAGVRLDGETHHIEYVENAVVPAFAW